VEFLMSRSQQALRWLFSSVIALFSAIALPCPIFAQSFQPRNEALEMSARIDELIGDQLRAHGIDPAPPASNSEILRRLSLDLTGVVPPVSEVRSYLSSQDSLKYRNLVEQLLNSPAHATHLALKWRAMMLPRKFDPEQAAGELGLQNWLRRQFADNKRYDQVVADLLVASGGDESGPALFYTSLGVKPNGTVAVGKCSRGVTYVSAVVFGVLREVVACVGRFAGAV
jgi:hypothetical protein